MLWELFSLLGDPEFTRVSKLFQFDLYLPHLVSERWAKTKKYLVLDPSSGE